MCNIIEIVLGLEMRVQDLLLNVHRCASDGRFPSDPHVN